MSPREAAAEAPARPVPTTITSNERLLAGLTNLQVALYVFHLESIGPAGILELSGIYKLIQKLRLACLAAG